MNIIEIHAVDPVTPEPACDGSKYNAGERSSASFSDSDFASDPLPLLSLNVAPHMSQLTWAKHRLYPGKWTQTVNQRLRLARSQTAHQDFCLFWINKAFADS